MMSSLVCTQRNTGGVATSIAAIQYNNHKDGLDQGTIAELPSRLVGRMDRRELILIIHCSEILASDIDLKYLDRGTLERLTHLARLSCKNRN